MHQYAGTGCAPVRTMVESAQDESYQDDNMVDTEDSSMPIAKGHSMVAASSEGYTALGIDVTQVGLPVTHISITLQICSLLDVV